MNNADDLFDVMEKNSRETRTKLTREIGIQGGIQGADETAVVDAFRKKQQERSTAIIYAPAPYSRKGAFIEEDARDHLERLKEVHKYLSAGMSLEETLRVNIQDWETEDTIEAKFQENTISSSQREKALNELAVKRETFLHFTILSYLGYHKSNYNAKVNALYDRLEQVRALGSSADITQLLQIATSIKTYLTHPLATQQPDKLKHVNAILEVLKADVPPHPDNEQTPATAIGNILPAPADETKVIPDEMIKAMDVTYKLAFKTLLEAFKKYNPLLIQTEEDLRENLRHQTADVVATGKINTIADLFAGYFSNNPLERVDYYNAMHQRLKADGTAITQQGIVEFLRKLEILVGLPDSASKIPVYFGVLEDRITAPGNGTTNGS